MEFINPHWFYWFQIINRLRIVCFMLTIITVLIIGIGLLMLSDAYSDKERKILKNVLLTFLIILLIAINGLIFLPSQETLIQMVIAADLTNQDISQTINTIIETAKIVLESIS